MTVIFLPRISHTNTFRHIKPQSEPARKLGSQNGFAVHWTGRVKITTVPNRTEPNRTGNGQNHALEVAFLTLYFLAYLLAERRNYKQLSATNSDDTNFQCDPVGWQGDRRHGNMCTLLQTK